MENWATAGFVYNAPAFGHRFGNDALQDIRDGDQFEVPGQTDASLCSANGAPLIARPYSTRDCEYRRAYRTPGIRLQRVRHCHLYCRGFNSRPDGSKQCIFRPGVLPGEGVGNDGDCRCTLHVGSIASHWNKLVSATGESQLVGFRSMEPFSAFGFEMDKDQSEREQYDSGGNQR